MRIKLLVLLFLFGCSFSHAFNAAYFSKQLDLVFSFETSPVAVNGVVEIYTGASVTFTDSSNNMFSGATYLWDFGNVETSNLVGPHTIQYDSVGDTVTLDINGSTKTVQVKVNAVPVSDLSYKFDSGWATTTFNGTEYFNYCGAGGEGSVFQFSANSTNTDTLASHVIDWGGGTRISSYTKTNGLTVAGTLTAACAQKIRVSIAESVGDVSFYWEINRGTDQNPDWQRFSRTDLSGVEDFFEDDNELMKA